MNLTNEQRIALGQAMGQQNLTDAQVAAINSAVTDPTEFDATRAEAKKVYDTLSVDLDHDHQLAIAEALGYPAFADEKKEVKHRKVTIKPDRVEEERPTEKVPEKPTNPPVVNNPPLYPPVVNYDDDDDDVGY